MAERTVRQWLDLLDAGDASLEEVAAAFRERSWPRVEQAPLAQAWGVQDDPVPGDDSWDAVNADPRLSPEQYRVLAGAYRQAGRKTA